MAEAVKSKAKPLIDINKALFKHSNRLHKENTVNIHEAIQSTQSSITLIPVQQCSDTKQKTSKIKPYDGKNLNDHIATYGRKSPLGSNISKMKKSLEFLDQADGQKNSSPSLKKPTPVKFGTMKMNVHNSP